MIMQKVPAVPNIGKVNQAMPGKSITGQGNDFKKSFGEILSDKTGLKLSKHALARLTDRNIQFNGDTAERLGKAVLAAGQKGADQSLVLLDEMAFVVSVKNRTIITAMGANQVKQGVFTEIDSAVIG